MVVFFMYKGYSESTESFQIKKTKYKGNILLYKCKRGTKINDYGLYLNQRLMAMDYGDLRNHHINSGTYSVDKVWNSFVL